MKKIALLITALSLFSCNDDYDINRDPDNLADAPMSVQLPAGIAGLAGAQGGYYALIGGFWSQFFTQANNSSQYKNLDDYSAGTNDFQAGWAAMYDAFTDIKTVKAKALAEGNWNYYLIASVLEVQGSQIMTDMYDDIPYQESNNPQILQPRFNSGQETYDLMVSNLKDALSRDLSASAGLAPGNDDFIFGGDMDNWTAYANTLLLKLYMRQTEARPTVAQEGIQALLSSGVAFLDTDAAMTQFEDAPNRSNPLFETDRRQLNTKTNLRASTTLFSFLTSNGDDRREHFYQPNENGNPWVSLNQGDFNNTGVNAGNVAVIALSATMPLYFMSREESLFLQAEALERYAGGVGAQAAYEAAVTENFAKWGEDATALLAGDYAYPVAGSFQDKLKAIITQKWVASFPGNGFESFFEQNRTGYPAISAVPQTSGSYEPGEFAYSVNGVTGDGNFPRRFVYPNSVKSRNANAPALDPVTTPVWWDVN